MDSSAIDLAVQFVKDRCSVEPDIAIVLGSGLGPLADEVSGVKIPYVEIPGFPKSTAPSHKGILHIGNLFGCRVVAMQGRVHLYEGYQPSEVVFPMQVMGKLGARTALLTNAAGALNEAYDVGDLAIIDDHLSFANLAGADPLRGPNDARIGPRFVSMNGAYSKDLIAIARQTGTQTGQMLRKGTYAFVTGPTFETPAEIRALRSMGCDLVGMSTVPEVMAARHLGMQVLAVSAVTNKAVSHIDDAHITNEEEVWEAVELIKPNLRAYIAALLPLIDTEKAP